MRKLSLPSTARNSSRSAKARSAITCQPAIRLWRCSIASSDSRRRTGGATSVIGVSLAVLGRGPILPRSPCRLMGTTQNWGGAQERAAQIMSVETARGGMRGRDRGGRTNSSSFASPRTNDERGGAMQRRRLAAAVLVALLAALLTMPSALGAQAGEQALVRVAHFAAGLLKGDVYVVYVDGRLQLKGVPFKTVSDYLKVKPGKFKVEVREAGEPANSPPVIAATVKLEAGKAYTVAVFGQLTSVKAALLTDDMNPPANSKSKVRL